MKDMNDSNQFENKKNLMDRDDSGDLSDKDPNFSDRKRIYLKKRICRFCTDKSLVIEYKNRDLLRKFTTEGGKIIPRRMSGNCAKHQRIIAGEIRRARFLALLPYVKK